MGKSNLNSGRLSIEPGGIYREAHSCCHHEQFLKRCDFRRSSAGQGSIFEIWETDSSRIHARCKSLSQAVQLAWRKLRTLITPDLTFGDRAAATPATTASDKAAGTATAVLRSPPKRRKASASTGRNATTKTIHVSTVRTHFFSGLPVSFSLPGSLKQKPFRALTARCSPWCVPRR